MCLSLGFRYTSKNFTEYDNEKRSSESLVSTYKSVMSSRREGGVEKETLSWGTVEGETSPCPGGDGSSGYRKSTSPALCTYMPHDRMTTT